MGIHRATAGVRSGCGVLAVALLFTACAAREEAWIAGPPPSANAIVILESGALSLQADAEGILKEAFPGAQRLRVEQLVTAGPRLRQDAAVLVVPNMAALTAAHWGHLIHHIHRGGPVLFWGLDPAGGESGGHLTMLRPATEYYAFSAREIRGTDGGMIQSVQPMRFQSAFPRARNEQRRWIPLAEAREPSGSVRGWPASLMIEAPTGGPLRAWGWIGWAPDARNAAAQRALLRRAARRLAERRWMTTAGLDRAALGPGETIRAVVTAVSAVTTTPLRLAVEMENADGVVTRRFTETLDFSAARGPLLQTSTSIVLGIAPRAVARAEDIRIRFALMDASGEHKLDEQTQRVRLLPDSDDTAYPADERLGVRGANFIIGRRPIALFGARFDPLLADANGAPLDARCYDAALAARELDLYREAGFNLVEVAFEHPAQAPQLRHLLDLMRERQLWAVLRIPALSPWASNSAAVEEWIAALRLPRAHRVFAIAADLTFPDRDPAIEPAVRRAWTAWVNEQYGDRERAERALELDPETLFPMPDSARDPNVPPAARRAIAHFYHDHVSRHLRHCRSTLEAQGAGILLTAVGGDAYPIPPDVHHVDFITRTLPAGLTPPEPGRLEFLTAHARGLSGGRAVLWRFGGTPLAYPAAPDEPRRAAETINAIGRALARARAAGLLCGPIGGGPRPPAGRDAGLVEPDTRWRPTGDAWRARIHEWRRLPAAAPVWRGREVDARTEVAWADWRDRVASEAQQGFVEEVRPLGWGRATRDLAVPGQAPTNPPAPFDYLNAEWIAPRSEDPTPRARLRQALPLELLNTGSAAWSPSVTGQVGAVWIRARAESGRTQWLAIRETAPGARAALVWTPTDPGPWTLRGWLHPAGEFGEALKVLVE